MSPLRWTCKSKAKLPAALTVEGWPVSASTVGRLLHGLAFRLHALQKAREGTAHPDRNAQFERINATATAFLPLPGRATSVTGGRRRSGYQCGRAAGNVRPPRLPFAVARAASPIP
jgi:hypothetical protein